MPATNSEHIFTVLKSVFKLPSFRPNQQLICEAILDGKDVLAILPTGGGKSLCYQLPAVCSPGLTIVISPLLSLINDQVSKLTLLGVAAAALTSQRSDSEKSQIAKQLQNDQLKLLYLSPEQLQTKKWQSILNACQISCVVVDEAHCLAEWGNDFRPAYLAIGKFVATLTKQPTIAAFTATATQTTSLLISRSLRLKQPLVVRQTAVRKNLRVIIHRCQSSNEKLLLLVSYLTRENHTPAIIYCSTRADTEIVAQWLTNHGQYFSERLPVSTAAYHAGLKSENRQQLENGFLTNQIEVLVATTAFGMGIDKANTRLVIHWQLPNSIENFCQEIGRAGRDQQPATSVLLSYKPDIKIQKTLIQTLANKQPQAYQQKISKLIAMKNLTETNRCLNRDIVDYFGEKTNGLYCGRCSNCLKPEIFDDNTRLIINKLSKWRSEEKCQHPFLPPIVKTTLAWLALLQPTKNNQLKHVPGFGKGLVDNWGRKYITANCYQRKLITACP